MARRIAFIVLQAAVIWLAYACSRERVQEGILTEAQMVKVMAEMYIAEERINRLSLPLDSAQVLASLVEQRIYTSTNVADSVFRRSFDYYMDRPRQLERIYVALIDSLQLREQRTPAVQQPAVQ